MSKYQTKQRDEILNFFHENEEKCFTAKEICSNVSCGEATVFRTLTTLTDEGMLTRYTGRRGDSAYYQLNSCEKENHIHLKCCECGDLIHMDCSIMSEFADHFKTHHDFVIDCRKTVIYGLCSKCSGGAT